ncbi:MAG: nitroreductase family protein [Desulforhabdus sp.]|jgi:nitroreductase|nr:nitroreductase family protein [Desulforhabdus sp.]
MATFEDIIRTRRSIRDFIDREVPPELVREVIEESSFAPSARNNQPWHFIIITSKPVIRELSSECKANLLGQIGKNPELPIADYKTALENTDFNIFYNAPCLIYIVGPRTIASLDVDCTLAASYIMFSAAKRGLGSCWIGLGAHVERQEVRNKIGLPRDHRIVAPIILGYPRAIPEALPREKPKILKIVS